MRALIERLFGELNARLDKFDQAILQLKESIESSKGGKAVESALNASSDGHGNSSMVQGTGKALTATGCNEKRDKGLCLFCDEKSTGGHKCSKKTHDVSLIEDDDDVDVPIADLVTTEETETETEMAISVDAVVEYSTPYDGGSCVTGYHGKQPLAVLMGVGGTSHNFINESLADKLGCETFPIKPRTVRSAFGKMVTSRACNNFQLSMQGTVFNLKLYLLPLSSNCDMVLGGEWLGILDKIIMSSDGVEFYFQGKKKFMGFNKNKSVRGCKR